MTVSATFRDRSGAVGTFDAFSAHQQSREPIHLTRDPFALLVVDMLNDFLEPGGRMVLAGGTVLYAPINALASSVRAGGGHVVWVMDRHRPDDTEFRKRSPHCLEGTWGAEIPAGLSVDPSDHLSPKRRFSAFFQSDLDLWLRERGVRSVVVCGVVTNICVRSTVHDAFFLGYDVVVVPDACAGTSIREHDSSLYDIATHYGSLAESSAVVGAIASHDIALEMSPPVPPEPRSQDRL
jgi:ureidoacrylate peracid hydrolase